MERVNHKLAGILGFSSFSFEVNSVSEAITGRDLSNVTVLQSGLKRH